MIYVGIDVASEKHDATILSVQGDVLTSSFEFENNIEGYKKLCTEIQSHTESNNVCIGMEHTGIYHQNIATYLLDNGFQVYVENASKIKNFIKSQSIRKTKTDKVDSLGIANYVRYFNPTLNPYTSKVYLTEELKSLTRLRHQKVCNLSKSKSELKRLLMISFPEFAKHFDPLSIWALELIYKYPTTLKLSRAHTTSLTEIIRTKSFREQSAILIKTLAKTTVGKNSRLIEIEVKACIEDILHIQNQVSSLDVEIKRLMQPFDFLLTIPGVSHITGATIIGEIGDIRRFEHKSKLLAFAGCDPTIHESGKFKAKNARISKCGSRYLRTALFHSTRAACVGKCKSNKFRDKYIIKMDQGKHHYSAIFNVAKNMLYTIYAMLNDESNFDFDM